MSDRDRIEIDFAKACEQAEYLESMAGVLSSIAKDSLLEAISIVDAIWKGDNAEKYVKKGKNYIPDILNTADELMKMAGNVRYTAEKIYEAEKKALGMIF